MTKRWLLTMAMVGCSAWATPDPDPHQPVVANLVANILVHQHYSPHAIDDKLSREWLESYIEQLDFNHMIFVESDIAEFQKWSATLDDDILSRKPKMEAATAIHSRYQQRLSERIAAARAFLASDINLNQDLSWQPDREEAPWPKSAAEADELWRQRLMDQMIARELQGFKREETLALFRKRYDRLEKDVLAADATDVLEYYLSALSQLFDPHSTYFKPATSEDFDIEISNSVEGIGAQLQTEGEFTVVKAIIPGGPADLDHRLQPGDKIIAVAQGSGPPEDVIDLRIDRVVRLIRGKKGTEVRLTVIPVDAPDPSQTQIIALVRDQVALTESDADKEIIEVGGQKIGVINVPSFYIDSNARAAGDKDYHSASRDVKRLLEELKAEGVDGVILDLRENGGGSLNEAIDLAGLFIDRGPVVQVRDREGRVEVLSDEEGGAVYDGPLMVLCSPLSASASEIVAGAIQDYGRGLVVGAETTHGKGTVQQVVDLDHFISRMLGGESESARAGALKVTTQKFYRVSGSSTQNKGVYSDIVIPSPWDGLEIYESDLDHALPWDEITPARFKSVGDAASLASLKATLAQRSAQRVQADADFAELRTDLAEREQYQDEKTVSLNLDKRREEAAARGELKTPEQNAAQAEVEAEEEEKNDFILREAAAIMADWLQLAPGASSTGAVTPTPGQSQPPTKAPKQTSTPR